MRVRVLGCHGAELPNHGTCGFLINRSILIDGGTICSALNLNELKRIRHILISHIHMDHIKGLPFLSENLIGQKGLPPITLISVKPVVDGLHRHLLNGKVWPDFTKIPNGRKPFFRLRSLREGQRLLIDGLEIRPFRVDHTVPCAGFLIRQGKRSLLYSGDTHQTDRIWKEAAKTADLKAAIIETSFPNALGRLAEQSGHLTPRLLREEFGKIKKPGLPLYVYHMKPRYLDRIRTELKMLGLPRLTMLKDGMVFTV